MGTEYLDSDDVRGITRYFDESPDLSVALRVGQCVRSVVRRMSTRRRCILALDEHSIRSCPITKFCFI
ncbi:hypothetical protein BJ165DRAFT_120770 [Panaeolus papilionaceus]|nr:hypothetical protein BJ165DRAFT_120770 [Panaeolus papilionaceus]